MPDTPPIFRHGPPESVIDRIAGGLMAGVFGALTTLFLPIFLASFSFGARYLILTHLRTGAMPFTIWCLALSGSSTIVGLALGIGRTIELFGHLWATYEPKNQQLTAQLWGGITISACATFAIVFPWERLLRGFGWTPN